MRVPVYMKSNVKCSDAGVNGGDGRFRVGGSKDGSDLAGQDSNSSQK